MNKKYKSIFPTFEEIDNGLADIIEHSYCKTVNGERRMYHKLALELVIANDHFKPVFSRIRILRDRKGNRLAFQPITAGKIWPPCFAYTESGWNDCVFIIKQELMAYRKVIEKIMNEEDIV